MIYSQLYFFSTISIKNFMCLWATLTVVLLLFEESKVLMDLFSNPSWIIHPRWPPLHNKNTWPYEKLIHIFFHINHKLDWTELHINNCWTASDVDQKSKMAATTGHIWYRYFVEKYFRIILLWSHWTKLGWYVPLPNVWFFNYS